MALTRYFHFRRGSTTRVSPPAFIKHNGLCWKRVDGERALYGEGILYEDDTYYGFTNEEDCYNFVPPRCPAIPPCDEVVYHLSTNTQFVSAVPANNSFVDHIVYVTNNTLLASRTTLPVADLACGYTTFLIQPDTNDVVVSNKTPTGEQMTVSTGTVDIDSVDTHNSQPVVNFTQESVAQFDVSSIGQAIKGTQDFTLEMWIKFDDVTKEHYVFNYDEPSRNRSNVGLIYRGHYGPKKWQFTVNYGSGSTSASNVWRVYLLTEQVNMQNDTWHHVALVRNNVSDWRFYLDGVLKTHTPTSTDGGTYGSYSGTIDDFPGPLYIGYDSTGFNGFKLRSMRVSNQALYTENSIIPPENFPSCVPGTPACDFIQSTDAGDTWQNSMSITPAPTAIEFLYQQRGGSKYTYTCVNNNMLYRSTDNGGSWSQVDTTAIDAEAITSMNELSTGDLLMSYNTGDRSVDEAALLIQSTTTDVNDAVVDSSSNKHHVSMAGSNYHQPVEAFMSQRALYFDGVNDYLSVAHSSQFNLAHDDFTLEFWINFTQPPTTDTGSRGTVVMNHGDGGINNAGWIVYGGNASHFAFLASGVGSDFWDVNLRILFGIDTDRWYHIAVVRDGSTFTSYVDGAQTNQITSNATIKNQNYPVVIGWSPQNTRTKFNGYLQGVRLTKKAIYTNNFTPPGMFFGAYVSKSVDNAVSWQPILSAESSDIVLSDTSKYMFASAPGQVLYRGSLAGDNWSSHAITEDIGTIVESMCAQRLIAGTTEGASKMLLSIDQGVTWSTQWETNSNYGTGTLLKIDNDHIISTLYDHATSYSRMLISSDAGETWSESLRTADSLSGDHVYAAAYNTTQGDLLLGTGTQSVNIYKIANYADPFVDRGGFSREIIQNRDVSWGSDVTMRSLTALDGVNSADDCYYFNGTTSKLQTTLPQAMFNGDWTVEAWIKLDAPWIPSPTCWKCVMCIGGHNEVEGISLYAPRGSANGVGHGSVVAILDRWRNANNINDTIGHTKRVDDGEWHHVALAKYGNKTTLYIDGRSENSVTDNINYTQNHVLTIGHDPNCGSDSYFHGWIKDLRITRGSAVYPAPYYTCLPADAASDCDPQLDTVPAVECQNRTLHLVASAGEISTDLTGNFTPVHAGGVKVSDTVELHSNKVLEFDGSGDYITIGNKTDWRFLHDGTTDYTLEYWVRPRAFDGSSGNNYYVNTGGTSNVAGISNYINSTGVLGYSILRKVGGTSAFGVGTQPGTIKLNRWQHVAVSYNKQLEELRLFVNGRLHSIGTKQASHYTGDPHTALTVGRLWREDVFVDYDVNGYMQDLRITKQCLYTGVLFEPPNNLNVPCV